MLNEVQCQTVLKFFLFLLIDEELALSYSTKASKQIQNYFKKNPKQKNDVAVIKSLWEIYLKNQSQISKRAFKKAWHPWRFLQSEKADPWRSYLKDSEPEIKAILVLRYILGFSPDLISEALQIPHGTVLFRMGRGLESVAEKLHSI